ncbi:MAG: tRNA-dihydrouridine synthase [Candidatus Pacebacteria bacterium]|nr:tRNA-dihydrouridine synthase [Candidatus Paceibacterota bacterium]
MVNKSKNFWQELSKEQKPFFCLAPMEDVTDVAFREMFAKFKHQSKALALFTEFTPSDGLAFGDEKAQKRLRAKLSYTEAQRPIVAQIYNSNPGRMEEAARLVQSLGFDGVDINMGCPVNAVVKQISGAALIKHPELAVSLMQAVREGAPNIPLSVKTRIGYSSKDDMVPWLTTILKECPEALTIHLRTRSQFSKVPADWSLMPGIIKLRDKLSPETVIIGNGDVQSVEHGKKLAGQYGCDGIMVGRAAFGTPDFFTQCPRGPLGHQDHQIKMLIEHIELFDKLLLKPGHKGYHVMKKHYKAYINGWQGAKELRIKLMDTNNPQEAIKLLQK